MKKNSDQFFSFNRVWQISGDTLLGSTIFFDIYFEDIR